MTLGLVCDDCDTLSPVSAGACVGCGQPLAILSLRTGAATVPPWVPPVAAPATIPSSLGSASVSSQETSARGAAADSTACPHCGNRLPSASRFCGGCGQAIEAPPPVGQTRYFGSGQQVGRARLISIRREGVDGVAFNLAGPEHLAGRIEGDLRFPDDTLLSPRHSSFSYRGNELFVRDEDSRNGVFVRLRAPLDLAEGQPFLVGEQLLAVMAVTSEPALPIADGTLFFSSPRRPARLKVIQILAGGAVGLVHRAHGETVTLGREGNDINFPDDPFISGRHAQLTMLFDGRFRLTDQGSKNGTFVRIRDEVRLSHGDYVFIGRQLLRVDVS